MDYDIFERVRPPSSAGLVEARDALRGASDLDFRLKTGSKAMDAGTPPPNVNDGSSRAKPRSRHANSASRVLVYGPRGASPGPFTR